MPDASTTSPHGNDDANFRISRTVNGPLDAVWKAYTNGGPTRHPMSAAWPLQTKSATPFARQPHESTVDEIAAFKAGHSSMTQSCNASFEQLDAHRAQLPRP